MLQLPISEDEILAGGKWGSGHIGKDVLLGIKFYLREKKGKKKREKESALTWRTKDAFFSGTGNDFLI